MIERKALRRWLEDSLIVAALALVGFAVAGMVIGAGIVLSPGMVIH